MLVYRVKTWVQAVPYHFLWWLTFGDISLGLIWRAQAFQLKLFGGCDGLRCVDVLGLFILASIHCGAHLYEGQITLAPLQIWAVWLVLAQSCVLRRLSCQVTVATLADTVLVTMVDMEVRRPRRQVDFMVGTLGWAATIILQPRPFMLTRRQHRQPAG
jgi:hypothetical protein